MEQSSRGPIPSAATESRLAIEQHGFDFIPEGQRYLSLKELFVFWVGTNAYIFFLVLGAAAVSIGLTLWQAILAVVVGNLLYALVAYGSIGGPRSGLPTMTFSRAAFGIYGNRVNSFLSWVVLVGFEVLNTLLGVFALVALFAVLGWKDSGAIGKMLAVVIVLGLSILIAIVGHGLMMLVQRFFAVALTAVLVAVFFATVGGVHWSATSATKLSLGPAFGLFLLATATVAAGPISYLVNCSDWPRYLPSRTSTTSIFWTVFAGSAIICVFLGVLGAMLASRTDMTDPVAGVKPLVPLWLFIPYAISVAGGSIANNVPTFYASGLTVQSAGIPLRRWRATTLDSVVATAIIIYVLFVSQNFTTYLNDLLSLVNVWMGPFGAVWIVDGVLRRWRYDPVDIHSGAITGKYYFWRGYHLKGLFALAVGMAVGLLTINSPIVHGYISLALWNGDLSWIAPWVVSGIVYYVLAAGDVRRQMGANEGAGERVAEAVRG